MRWNSTFIALTVSLVFVACAAAEATETFIPWNFVVVNRAVQTAKTPPSWPTVFSKSAWLVYGRYISPVDGDRCHMYPTCSAFSREAVEKYGFFRGALLTADRLIHESNEQDRAPQIIIAGRLRFLDPVSNNDFWWR